MVLAWMLTHSLDKELTREEHFEKLLLQQDHALHMALLQLRILQKTRRRVLAVDLAGEFVLVAIPHGADELRCQHLIEHP